MSIKNNTSLSRGTQVISIAQLKERGCGTAHGYISGSANKAIFYDATDKVELILFGEIPLKPKVLYEIKVQEMVLGDCIPVRSTRDIRVVSDDVSPCTSPSQRWNLRSNEKSEYVFYIKEKSNKIKQSRFFVTTLMCKSPSDKPQEVFIHNLKAEWFLYLIPGKFYTMLNPISLQSRSENSIFDLRDVVCDVAISVLSENTENLTPATIQKIDEIKKSIQDQRRLVSFSDVRHSRDSFLFVNIEAEVVGMSSFEKSGFITFADTNKTLENIAFTPARRTLPRFLVPGSRVIMYQLFMKSVQNGSRHFLSVTHMTQIYLISLPNPTISLSHSTLLNDTRTLQKSNLVSIIVEIDCILSLTINTVHNISCRLSVRDVSDSATLHVKDNLELVRELFELKERDEEVLGSVTNVQFGKIDRKESSGVLQIFSKILQVCKYNFLYVFSRYLSCNFLKLYV